MELGFIVKVFSFCNVTTVNLTITEIDIILDDNTVKYLVVFSWIVTLIESNEPGRIYHD